MTATHHPSHPDIVNRLRRAEGHLRKVVEMIEGGRHCLDVVQQLYAVESAINRAKAELIKDHLDHCLESVVAGLAPDQRREFDDFKTISKYL